MSTKRFEGKVVVVTGGASGIGKTTTERFLEEGARVAIIDISEEAGRKALSDMKCAQNDSLFVAGDVSKASDVKSAVDRVIERFGRIDVLFCNAGILVEGTVEEVTEAEWDRIMAVNVKGVFLMAKEVIPHMLKQGKGVIVNNASCSGLVGDREAIAYNASKAAVVVLTKCLALDYALNNIRANCVCPGEIETPMFLQEAATRGLSAEDHRKDISAYHPIGRLGKPKEVADAVLFLASDDSSFITGTAFSVDGGYTAQ
ncbi:MAG: SDR family oxidoreductase [Methanobacteriota archaeon]|nr:MAG: SDR family oxidoreductase [Euryarchaeota archaeon]